MANTTTDVQMSNGDSQTEFENGAAAGESYLESLHIPAVVTKRVNALKNLQRKLLEVEAKFYEEIHILECKYASMYEPLFMKREQIVSGEYEPSEEETKWALDAEEEQEVATALDNGGNKEVNDLVKDLKAKVNLQSSSDAADTIKGIPDFWLHTFKSTDLISEMIQEYDEPVLKHLRDVRVRMHDQKPYGYTIEFHFNENEFFTNKVLTKTYELSTEVDDKDPFSFDGPVLYKSTGCKIEWNKGKDVTMRLVKKKQKHKSSGMTRVIHKEEKQDSFFNYFDNPTETGMRPSDPRNKNKPEADKDIGEDEDSDSEERLCEADFEIGQFLKDFLIPKAVLYFTGELVDTASYGEYDEDEEEDEDGDDYEEGEEDEEEEEEPEDHKKGRNGRAPPKRQQTKGKHC